MMIMTTPLLLLVLIFGFIFTVSSSKPLVVVEKEKEEGVKAYDPKIFLTFLKNNKLKQCAERADEAQMPLSFYVTPDYWDGVPLDQRVPAGRAYTQPQVVPACQNQLIQPGPLNDYEFETERFLATLGLNIYDGAVYSIASALLGQADDAINYETTIIAKAATCQFSDIRGDAPCKGVINSGECTDPAQGGSCGFCYGTGSNNDRTMPKANAWTFRMLSDYWLLQGTVDARCPNLGVQWTWNDYRPVLGENAWASLTGPLQVAYIKYGSVTAIPNDDVSITMAVDFIGGLTRMLTSVGAVSYSPKNTITYGNYDTGFDVSTENNVSLLAGLKMILYVLTQKNIHPDQIPIITSLINNVISYIKSSYDPTLGYFRQGGSFSNVTGAFAWHMGDTGFAVDCQTWTLSVIGPTMVDSWFGAGTSANIWATTKKLGGYNYVDWSQEAEGVGFSVNSETQVFSGEWTFGAINMLRVFTQATGNGTYAAEGSTMRDNISLQLTQTLTVNGQTWTSVNYANKRYWIPFGWWSNPVPSTASTGWAVFIDSSYNPFYLGGRYLTNY